MDDEARRQNFNYFLKNQNVILIVTDVAARGLDIPLLNVVISVDYVMKRHFFIEWEELGGEE